ncbi:autotransporter domain-containing protein [Methyloligella solikamskensis]|uniref:Autotransporter domain-containing protein n=1 Tax=Methyloligella solikamskensis TaxID=1177756 RepID=A0ABW3J909_9HYPH
MAPTPAHAVRTCSPGDAGVSAVPGPIDINTAAEAIDCENVFDRNNSGDPVIDLQTYGGGHPITLDNSGDLTSPDDRGIRAYSRGSNSAVSVTNTGDIDSDRTAIYARTSGTNSTLYVSNSGHLTVGYSGIWAVTGVGGADGGSITVINTGDMDLESPGVALDANSYGTGSTISITNSGAIAGARYGVNARATGDDAAIDITNSGELRAVNDAANLNFRAFGIDANAYGEGSGIDIVNSGDIRASGPEGYAYGINAESRDNDSAVHITNSASIQASAPDGEARGINAETDGDRSSIEMVNDGDIDASADDYATGLYARSTGNESEITITNSGNVRASTSSTDYYATGIFAYTTGTNSSITIENSGSVYAEGMLSTGIYVYSQSANPTTITNTGEIGASSNLAIDVYGQGTSDIYNAGTITGYMKLTDQRDRFFNQTGGLFEAKETSLFGEGDDLFRNEAGGTVHVDGNASFEDLERFENRGLISLADGQAGDSFTISNTPGGMDTSFVGSGNSTLAVDAVLAGPGNSSSDSLTIEGSATGVTTLQVNNLNPGLGVFNGSGLRIVTATGPTPNPNAFQLDQPVDAGFFNYDLFFTPTGAAYGPGVPSYIGGAEPHYEPASSVTPAVWVKGSGGWLDRDDSVQTTAYGRGVSFNLDRDLETIDFQTGLDMGKRDLWSPGDALVFGVLGGFVSANLDYDSLARRFNFSGGQIGAYATYLNGGLFVDTLANLHLYELEAGGNAGFPDSLDANTFGLRSDAGYRFGSFSGGAFIEPLATLEVTWADIDGFSVGGNSISFDDDPNVRGRLGLRTGTTMEAWEGTLMEPFVTGSLWGNLSGDNQATLVSSGTTFTFQDDLQDVWGEVSAGVNFFNFSETTTVFAKADVTFGDDISGIGGKAGMRVAW